MDPDTVTRPSEVRSAWRACTSTGRSSPPIDTIVTPDAPVSGVKNASTAVVTSARPPGIQPKSAVNSRVRRSAGVAFGEKVAAQRKERNGGQHRRGGQTVGFAGDRIDRRAVHPEQEQGRATDRDKDRETKGGGSHDDQAARNQNACRCQLGYRSEEQRYREAQGCEQSTAWALCGMPHKPARNDRKADRQNRQDDPRRDAPRHNGARCSLDSHQIQTGDEKRGCDACSKPTRRDFKRCAPARGNEVQRWQRQQPIESGREHRADDRDPQREMLDEDDRAGHAPARGPAHDFDERERRHHARMATASASSVR